MKSILAAIVFFLTSFQARAEGALDQAKIATTADHSFVVAAFPYFPRSVRKTLEGKFSSNDLPIGLLIQNYSDDYLRVLKVRVQPAHDNKNWVVDYYTAYSERPVGAIGGRTFFDNGEELNNWAHEKFHKGSDYLLLAQNEVFEHDSFLEPKKSYHGLLFLSLRSPNCKRNEILSLQRLELTVDLYSFKAKKVFKLKIPFSGGENSTQSFGFADWKKRSDEYSNSTLLPLDDASTIGLFSSLSACVQKALVAGKPPHYVGAATTVVPKFNYRGDLISYDLAQSSGNPALDQAIFSVFDGLNSCKFSEPLIEKLKRSSIQEIPMTFSYGDSCRLSVPREVTERAQAKLQERLNEKIGKKK